MCRNPTSTQSTQLGGLYVQSQGYIKLGTHRRIRFNDLMKYKKRRDAERERALGEIARMSQELGMYD